VTPGAHQHAVGHDVEELSLEPQGHALSCQRRTDTEAFASCILRVRPKRRPHPIQVLELADPARIR
jgi:hypothetical protein